MAIADPAASRPLLRRLAMVALACLVGVAGCSNDPSRNAGSHAAAGLVVLSGAGGTTRLTTYDANGSPRELTGPGGDAGWISASRRGTLVATMADSTLRLSDRVRSDRQPAWRTIPEEDEHRPAAPLAFAQWAPSGDRLVAMATEFGDEADASLYVVDAIGNSTLEVAAPRGPRPAPPAWVDEQHVAVLAPTAVSIVDIDTGDVTAVPGSGSSDVAFADVSGDGFKVALATRDRSSVTVRVTDDWVAGRGSPEATIREGGVVGSLALDRRADRLAVAWTRGPGANATVVIYERRSGWREAARLELPGVDRAALAWMP